MSARIDPDPNSRRRPRRRPRARFEVGRVLGTGLSIWFSGVPAFVALTAVVFLPYAFVRIYFEGTVMSAEARVGYVALTQLLQSLSSLVVTATVIYAVFQRLRRRKVGMRASIVYGLARVPAVIGVSLLIGLVIAVIAMPAVMFLLLDVPAAAFLVAIPTFVVFVVVQCGLWVAVPACVVERPGVLRSLSRSWALTKGSKGSIFLLLILFWIISSVIALGATLVVGLFSGNSGLWAELLVSLGLTVVVTSMTAVVTAVGYHELRRKVDGIDSEELAAIFD